MMCLACHVADSTGPMLTFDLFSPGTYTGVERPKLYTVLYKFGYGARFVSWV